MEGYLWARKRGMCAGGMHRAGGGVEFYRKVDVPESLKNLWPNSGDKML